MPTVTAIWRTVIRIFSFAEAFLQIDWVISSDDKGAQLPDDLTIRGNSR
jgi:hypothetical protein